MSSKEEDKILQVNERLRVNEGIDEGKSICRPPARWKALRPRAERHGPHPVSVSRANFSFSSVFFYFLIFFWRIY
jgi:hypothetical protein